jgi:aryl-alcohol dehydrogenase (NADP+)
MPEGGRAGLVPDRYSPSRPEVAAKLERIESLVDLSAEAGVPLTHLALAFVLTHPAVTAAIIGPRTMEQLTGTLGALDVTLSDEVLDGIDTIVAPGTTVDPSDAGWTPPAIADAWRRRRPLATRGGAR